MTMRYNTSIRLLRPHFLDSQSSDVHVLLYTLTRFNVIIILIIIWSRIDRDVIKVYLEGGRSITKPARTDLNAKP